MTGDSDRGNVIAGNAPARPKDLFSLVLKTKLLSNAIVTPALFEKFALNDHTRIFSSDRRHCPEQRKRNHHPRQKIQASTTIVSKQAVLTIPLTRAEK